MTNFTNEQLEAWAGCTQKDPEPITQDMWNDRMALFSKAKQHAPKLAAALLAERKAREVEVGELRAAAEDLVSLCSADVKMNSTTYQPMPYRPAFTKAVERLIEALKGQRDDK